MTRAWAVNAGVGEGLPICGEGINQQGIMSDLRSAVRAFDKIGLVATLLLPLALTHLRGVAEASIDVLAIGMLVRSVLSGEWAWCRRPWFVLSLVWWGWQVLCSMPFGPFGIGRAGGFGQALAAVRFLVMAAALQNWTLRSVEMRRWMMILVTGCGLYIGAQILLQAVTGYNLFGVPRFHDGTLTGPYTQPRAAAPLSRLLLPVLMLGCAWVAARVRGWRATAGMSVLAVVAVMLMVLAGQRMPLVLFVLGVFVCAVLYRPMRLAAGVMAVALPVLVALAAVVSPGSFFHLVVLAREQLGHFAVSPYGRIFTRAVVMAQADPLTGLGYDAFRHGCADPHFFHGVSWLGSPVGDDGGEAAICVQHAHNHYLEALTNAGLPGLGLFCAMIVGWLGTLLPRAGHGDAGMERAWRIGLFAAVFVQEWPFASASDFMNLPLGGWAFLLLGVGLAYRLPVSGE